MKIKGIIYILLAALIYGFTPLLCAFTYPLGNNGFSMTFFRSFFVIPILYLIIVLRKDIALYHLQFVYLVSIKLFTLLHHLLSNSILKKETISNMKIDLVPFQTQKTESYHDTQTNLS